MNDRDPLIVNLRDYECAHAALEDLAAGVEAWAVHFFESSKVDDPEAIEEITALHSKAADLVRTLIPKMAKVDREILFATAEAQGEDGAETVKEFEDSYPLLAEAKRL